jgi:hypothetical protein
MLPRSKESRFSLSLSYQASFICFYISCHIIRPYYINIPNFLYLEIFISTTTRNLVFIYLRRKIVLNLTINYHNNECTIPASMNCNSDLSRIIVTHYLKFHKNILNYIKQENAIKKDYRLPGCDAVLHFQCTEYHTQQDCNLNTQCHENIKSRHENSSQFNNPLVNMIRLFITSTYDLTIIILVY